MFKKVTVFYHPSLSDKQCKASSKFYLFGFLLYTSITFHPIEDVNVDERPFEWLKP
jgi:hypothetical protein